MWRSHETLINLLLAPKLSGNSSPVNLNRSLVDNYISTIKYPPSITKKPMKISDLVVWQTKDYRNFFFFIFPLLKFLISNENLFLSVMELRKGLYLLLLSNPGIIEIQKSKECFAKFLDGYKFFYNEYSMTPNFHDLDHLPDCVQTSGPLYEYSGFNFEHLNGRLKEFFRGNKRVDKQIIKKVSNFIKAQSELFKNSFCNIETPWAIKKFISSVTGICGKSTEIFSDIKNFETLFDLTSISKIYSSNRALFRNKKISTSSYNEGKPLNTSYFLSKDFSTLLEVTKIYFITHLLESDLYFSGNLYNIAYIDHSFFKKTTYLCESNNNLNFLFENFNYCVISNDFCIGVPSIELF